MLGFYVVDHFSSKKGSINQWTSKTPPIIGFYVVKPFVSFLTSTELREAAPAVETLVLENPRERLSEALY